MPFILTLLVFALTVGALIDIITRNDSQVKFLPKMVWILIVILVPLIGSGLWFALGREYSGGGIPVLRMPRRAGRPAPAPSVTPTWSAPTDRRTTEEQIADLDREIEEWRLRQEAEKRKPDPSADDDSSAAE